MSRRSNDKFSCGTSVETNKSLRQPDDDTEEAPGYPMDLKHQVSGLVWKYRFASR